MGSLWSMDVTSDTSNVKEGWIITSYKGERSSKGGLEHNKLQGGEK